MNNMKESDATNIHKTVRFRESHAHSKDREVATEPCKFTRFKLFTNNPEYKRAAIERWHKNHPNGKSK